MATYSRRLRSSWPSSLLVSPSQTFELPLLPFHTLRILTGGSGFVFLLFQASFLQTEKKKKSNSI